MERDFPVGHPAASDYAGEPYSPPRAPYTEDFAEGHPARDGKNVSTLDTPDGLRAAHLQFRNDLVELAMVGSLPRLVDFENNEPIPLTPEQLATVYALRHGLLDQVEANGVRNGLAALLEERGWTEHQAHTIIENYCTPISQK